MLPADFWLMLGECQSKCEHIAGVPLRPIVAKQLNQMYLAKGARATTAIEGNTLSEEQVRAQIEGKLKLPASQEYLAQEVENVVAACSKVWDHARKNPAVGFSAAWIRELNEIVLKNLQLDPEVQPGRIRTHSVGVGSYRCPPAEDCAFLLERLCGWLNDEAARAPRDSSISFAIIRAVIAHCYLAWIHPFGDGNGRTARLIEFQILIQSGVPAPSAHLLSNHYNLTRMEYYRQLERSVRTDGDLVHFLRYAVTGLRDGLREQIGVIRAQQWDVVWRNFVHEQFRDKTSPSDVRRRHLVLDLSLRDEPTPTAKLSEVSTRMARAYAGKTEKTIARDVNALIAMKLLEKTPNGIRARKESILAFLPPRTPGGSESQEQSAIES